MRVLGVDPGLRRCGWGVIEQRGTKLIYIASGVIAPDPLAPLCERLQGVFNGVCAAISEHAPVWVAVEDAFFHKNAASALKLGHARAACLLAAAEAGLEVQEFAPRLVKKSVVGHGAAEKGQVAAMVAMLLPGCRATADAADALAVAITSVHHVDHAIPA